MTFRAILKRGYYTYKTTSEFIKDTRFFLKNYMFSSQKKENLKFNILMLSHSLEKGLCNTTNPRPFGIKKVNDLKNTLDTYECLYHDSCYETNLGISILQNYIKFYEKYNFTQFHEYIETLEYLRNKKNDLLKCGTINYEPCYNYNSFYEFTKSRHSVRNFQDNEINYKDIEYAINCAILAPSACNRQMIKTYIFYNSSSKINIINHYAQGLSGFDIKNINYIVITYDQAAFAFPGERHQGMFNSGLFSMNLVNGLHERKIGSCFIQFANNFNEEKKIKQQLDINISERIAAILAFGYYANQYIIPSSIRKDINDVMIVKK